jgi:hypothetical protein
MLDMAHHHDDHNNDSDKHNETAIAFSEESCDDHCDGEGPTSSSRRSSVVVGRKQQQQDHWCVRGLLLLLAIATTVSVAFYFWTMNDDSEPEQQQQLGSEYYYNIGGNRSGSGWNSDESIYVRNDNETDAIPTTTVVRLCDDVTNIFCTARQSPVLTFRFDPKNYPTVVTMIHLYFVRGDDDDDGIDNNDGKSSPLTIYVDGQHQELSQVSLTEEDFTFVVTAAMGKELQVRSDPSRPPLLAGIVLSNRLPEGLIPTQTNQGISVNHQDYRQSPSMDHDSYKPSPSPSRTANNVPTASKPNNTRSPVATTYVPGDLLQHSATGLFLSRGLTARVLATANRPVVYQNGKVSNVPFHTLPDAGATFPTTDGGWIYVSNSEVKPNTKDKSTGAIIKGGVGALRFNAKGEMQQYQLGGRTPWGAWISGEEVNHTGRIWQVDPAGIRPAQPIPMGDVHSGLFESFAYDVRDRANPHFFMTQDDLRGALRRL